MNQIPVLIPAILLFTSFAAFFGGMIRLRWGYAATLLGVAASFLVSMAGVAHVIANGEIRYHLGGWAPPVGIEWVLDPLSAFMVAIVTTIGLLVVVYLPRSARFEIPGKEAFAYPSVALLLAGLTGMCLTGDVFNLYVFLEIAALAAYALLAVGDRRAPVAVFRYLVFGAVGGGFYLLGVGFLYFSAGTLNMADLAERLPELYQSRAVIAAAVLMVTGLGLKMALFPMHLWLPDVYNFAPSASAGLIAPIMTKVSAYAIIRLFLDVFHPVFLIEILPVTAFIGWLAAGGILFGSVMAMAQTDLRRMLAYSSVGQISYIALGIGLANPFGLIGGLLHMLNHALMKGVLFLIGGAIRLRTGLVEVPEFAGLGRKMPWTMASFTIAALAMVGIPPTAGFFSKYYLLLGSVDAGNWIFFAIIIVSSLLSAVYFFRVIEMIYREPEEGVISEPAVAAVPAGAMAGGGGHGDSLPPGLGGGPRHDDRRSGGARPPEEGGEAPGTMLLPILVLAVLILLVGIFNVLIVDRLLEPVVAPLSG